MNDYQKLIDYYKQYFDLVDCFHFNSEISKSMYHQYVDPRDEKVVSITHRGIDNHCLLKAFGRDILHVGFIGNDTPYKGLPLLKSVLMEMHKDSAWKLSVWGGKVGKDKGLPVFYRGKFNEDTVVDVYTSMDVLIVPSIWKETFSLVVLEALSYGVPVIVSSNVGAQDLVKQYDIRFIYDSADELKKLLLQIIDDRDLLVKYNQAIMTQGWKHDVLSHAQEIIDKVYK